MSGVPIYDHIPIHDLDDDNLFTSLNHPLLYLFNQLFLPVNLTQTRKHSSRMRTARLPTIRKGGCAVLRRSGCHTWGEGPSLGGFTGSDIIEPPPAPRGTE